MYTGGILWLHAAQTYTPALWLWPWPQPCSQALPCTQLSPILAALPLSCVPAQLCPALCGPVDCNPQLLCPWDSPGKNTIRGCHFLLQGLPDPVIKPISPASPALAGRLSLVPPGKINFHFHLCLSLWQKNTKPLSWFTCPESLSPELGPMTALHRDKKALVLHRPTGLQVVTI